VKKRSGTLQDMQSGSRGGNDTVDVRGKYTDLHGQVRGDVSQDDSQVDLAGQECRSVRHA
jgi:hypothetical protein